MPIASPELSASDLPALTTLPSGSSALYRSSASGAGHLLRVALRDGEHEQRVLRAEFELRGDLDPAWAAVPIEQIRVGSRAALLLSDPGGRPLSAFMRQPGGIGEFLRLAASAGRALAALHARGRSHGGLTPGSLLVADDLGHAALCEFGSTAGREAGLALSHDRLPYAAPERLAGLDALADPRADLYSLGCILRELLLGQPLFAANDALGWSHAHLAKPVAPVRRQRPELPECVDEILLRLLAKNAADRYPSVAELLDDIAACTADAAAGRLGSLRDRGQAGAPGRAAGIHGRQVQLAVLEARLADAARGQPGCAVFIAGEAGGGKTALVQHFLDRHAHAGTLRAASKASATEPGVPFGMVSEVLAQLLTAIMAAPESDFAEWRVLISERLVDHLPSLCRIVPEFGAFLDRERGGAPPAREREHQALLAAIVGFVAVVAAKAPPLVLFFDDLQWADPHSQEVVRLMCEAPEVRGVLTIGSFRQAAADGEPLPVPPAAAGEDHERRTRLDLRPLRLEDLRALLAARYGHAGIEIDRMAGLLHRKSGGNPFFVRQLLLDLERDAIIAPASADQAFHCDFERLVQRTFTGDVLTHLRQRMARLPDRTRRLMRTMACLGDRIALEELGAIVGSEPREVRARLRPAIDEDCVRIDAAGTCAFVHDRFHEAVYGGIEDDERIRLHHRIGQHLLALLGPDSPADKLFQAARQLNEAAGLVDDARRPALVRLNLDAAEQARAMTAYGTALDYLAFARTLSRAAEHEELPARIALLTAECRFLDNAAPAARAGLEALLALDIALPLRGQATRLLTAVYTSLNLSADAVACGLAFLDYAGIRIPARPRDADVDGAWQALREELAGRHPAELAGLPFTGDPAAIAVIDVMADLIPPALFSDVNLHDMVALSMARMSVRSGPTDSSCYGYVCLMIAVGVRYGELAAAYAFGELAVALAGVEGRGKYRARTLMGFGMFVLPWQRPVQEGARFIRAAFEVAKADGDQTFAVYCGRNLVSNLLISGVALDAIVEQAQRALAFAELAGFHLVIDAVKSQLRFIESLTSEQPLESGNGRLLPRGGIFAPYDSEPTRGSIAEFCFWTHRMQACLVFGDTREALAARARAEPIAWSSRAFNEIVDLHFYGALATIRAALLGMEGSPGEPLAPIWRRHTRQLESWAAQCPENFAGRVALLDAQRRQLEGAPVDEVIDGFERAIEHAQRQGFLQDEALSHELAAEYFAARGSRSLARHYLAHARDCYARWGAKAKLRLLDADPLLAGRAFGRSARPATDPDQARPLDVLAVVKASNALSSEIVQARVVETIMATALELGGAQRAVLLGTGAAGPCLLAEASLAEHGIQVQTRQALEPDTLPMTIVNVVSRSLRSITLDDAARDFTFGKDPYFRHRRVCSAFCLPLLKQGRLVSVLYLENTLVAGAFAPSRTDVIEVLASQAAIALENARLYEELLNEGRERARMADRLRIVQTDLEHASRLSTMGELVASIVHEVSQPINSVGTSAAAAIRWIDRNPPEIAEAVTMLRQIGADSGRAKSIIQGLRSLTSKSAPTLLPFALHEAIDDVLPLVRARARQCGIEIERGFDAAVANARGDRVQIQQVLINLLTNAIDAMPGGPERQAVITVATERLATGCLRVSVIDAGVGLQRDDAQRIFEPFYTTKAEGMGMGLAICRSIMEAHGGTLGAEPNPAGGTIMRFTVPAA